MAYENRNYNRTNSYDSRPRQGSYNSPRPEIRIPGTKELPADPIEAAERIMAEQVRNITTSKLRNILSLLMDVYNTEILRTDATLSESSVTALQLARIRIAYECGRDRNTKVFVEATDLIPYLKGVSNSRERAIRFIHYVEALVAYHRYFGGREN